MRMGGRRENSEGGKEKGRGGRKEGGRKGKGGKVMLTC